MTGVHLSDRHTLGHVIEGDADAIAHFARQPPWPLPVTNIKSANQLHSKGCEDTKNTKQRE